jgi:hypothetical protein
MRSREVSDGQHACFDKHRICRTVYPSRRLLRRTEMRRIALLNLVLAVTIPSVLFAQSLGNALPML